MTEQLRTTELSVLELTEKPPKYLNCTQVINEGSKVGKCKPFSQRVRRLHPCHICPEAISDHETIGQHLSGSTRLRPGFDSIETRTNKIRVEHMRGEITVRSR